ncbi:hypothetical protein Hypma_010872 [Hypsizygus marmoreus]|uniref:Uncharacterized protein n=1 Tax=Hypsizygus marmoreus TaxID=39966 RepID=A0A369JJL3_HYPMA|nr:hypothetical protein Hypma_010872 [Hypsizygus marmoreus]
MPLDVPNLHTPGRKLYYAFDVNRAWIVQYAETYWDDYMGTDVEEVEDDAKISSAIYMLITRTGVSNMTFGLGLPNDTSAANGTTTVTDGRVTVPLITVCSSRRGSYLCRPTQAQFDRLEGIVGRRAHWWIDAEPDY